MKNLCGIAKAVVLAGLAFGIPALLAIDGLQSNRYALLENEIRSLETKQDLVIEDNKHLISDIGMLSSFARIEKIAIEELGMHKADSEEIIRIGIGK